MQQIIYGRNIIKILLRLLLINCFKSYEIKYDKHYYIDKCICKKDKYKHIPNIINILLKNYHI